MSEDARALLVDIRSSMEFLFVGHPRGAVHVPWIDEPDWDINPHFLPEIRKLLLGGAVCDAHAVRVTAELFEDRLGVGRGDPHAARAAGPARGGFRAFTRTRGGVHTERRERHTELFADRAAVRRPVGGLHLETVIDMNRTHCRPGRSVERRVRPDHDRGLR